MRVAHLHDIMLGTDGDNPGFCAKVKFQKKADNDKRAAFPQRRQMESTPDDE